MGRFIKTDIMKTAEVKEMNLPSGTELTKVKCYDSDGRLVDVDYFLKTDPKHDELVADAKEVAPNYFTETWNAKIK